MATRTYQLTAKLVAEHGAGAVICLAETAVGRAYKLHASRPGEEQVERITRAGILAEVINAPGFTELEERAQPEPSVMQVVIRGPLEQRAHYRDSGCGGGWTDGYDAVADRMVAALESGDVVMIIDSPGGVVPGLAEAVRRIQKAKAEFKRSIVAYADEQICSAAYWLAASVADDIYIPAMGECGSIGARAAHESIAGMLNEAGVEVTHFGWPGEGKYAFAKELPLSDVARERATRDINACGEAFAAAVVAARPGVTRDQIIELDADTLTGIEAVKAGLVDGVASLDEVVAMAITRSEENEMARRAEEEEPMESSEDEEPEEGAEDESPEEDAEDDDGTEDEPEDAEDDAPEEDEAEDDEEEPVAKKVHARRGGASARAPRSLAALAGLPAGASTPAILSALTPVVGLARHLMAETGSKSPAAARGALKAIMSDAASAGQLRADLSYQRRRNNARRRRELLRKLQAGGVHERGELFVDSIHPTSGKRTTKPAPIWQEMKLATLEQYAATKLASAAPRRLPAAPDGTKLEQAGKGVTARDHELAQRGGYDAEAVAKARRALFPNTPRGV